MFLKLSSFGPDHLLRKKKDQAVRKLCCIWIGLCLCGLPAGTVRAETYQLNNGQTLSGEVVSYDENGLIVRLPDDKYSDRVPWMNFSQAALRKLGENPKIAPLVEPFIEISPAERLKRTEVDIRPVPRLQRPAAHSLLGALFSSSVGAFVLLLLYAANLYAAYEIAIFRAKPMGLVCGVSAVLPLIGPLVFLGIPARGEQLEEVDAPPQAPAVIQPFGYRTPGTAPPAGDPGQGGLRVAGSEGGHATGEIPQTQVFRRGAFTFNRRFFETKFPGFFGIVHREAEKDMALVIQSARGYYIVHRISRIAANELHVQVHKGAATEEVMIPFSEVQEVQLKHVKG